MTARSIFRSPRFQRFHDARSVLDRKPRYVGRLALGLLLCCLGINGQAAEYRIETVAEGLRWPWSVALLPDERFLVTEREGRLLLLEPDGKRRALEGTPKTLFAGQGGYFDVILHPGFERNGLLFLSYADGSESANGVAVFRARLVDGQLREGQQIFRARPDKITPQHYGGRMAFLADGSLLLTSGEGFEQREAAQDRTSELGKVLRVDVAGPRTEDEKPKAGPSPNVFTFGHRNPQGLVVHPGSGEIFLHEHGPRGGDELNILSQGQNYGWPAVTHGVDYSGAYVSPFRTAPGMVDPIWTWVPSIAPSGMAWYDGPHFSEWQDSLLIGALVDREVRRLQISNGQVQREESLFSELGERIRDVRVLNGDIYLLTDSEDGRLLKIVPR